MIAELFGRPPAELPPGRWDPAIAEGIRAMIAEADGSPSPLAVLDWDETCIRGDISETWLTYLDEADPRPLLAEYEAGCAVDKRAAYEKLAIDLVEGRTEIQIRRAVLAACERAVAEGRIELRTEIRDLVWLLHRHGWEVWVVSASATPVVQPLAERYGIHPHRVLGMQCHIAADGRYHGPLHAPVTYREGKLAAVRQWIDRPPTFAAGDSEGDQWLLRAAPHRLLIDRGAHGDPGLRALAHAEGWWVQTGWS